MTEAERAAIKERSAQWARAAPVLQAVRDEDIRNADTAQSIAAMTGLFLDARANFPLRADSGLVEQQRWFQKLRRV